MGTGNDKKSGIGRPNSQLDAPAVSLTEFSDKNNLSKMYYITQKEIGGSPFAAAGDPPKNSRKTSFTTLRTISCTFPPPFAIENFVDNFTDTCFHETSFCVNQFFHHFKLIVQTSFNAGNF